jgi:hypothetical protein
VDFRRRSPHESCREVGTRMIGQEHREEEDPVGKDYQNQRSDPSQPTVPESMSMALTELVGRGPRGIVGLGGRHRAAGMAAIMETDVTGARGPPRPGADGDSAWPRRQVGEFGRPVPVTRRFRPRAQNYLRERALLTTANGLINNLVAEPPR